MLDGLPADFHFPGIMFQPFDSCEIGISSQT